jgi:hypothetical protein
MKAYTYQEIRDDPSILDGYIYKDEVPLRCTQCDKVYTLKQKFVKSYIKKYDLNFCSQKCRAQSEKKQQKVACKTCGTEVIRKRKEIKKTKNNFCSLSCSATYHNKNKKYGTKRSKLEVWLEGQLLHLYPNLEFHFNQNDTIGSELDIYIPSLKLAFELNGIFHYEPIFGVDKLEKTQNTDSNKFQRCIEHEISLCVVDISQQKYFKVSTSKKYLDIITNIIDKNIGDLGFEPRSITV